MWSHMSTLQQDPYLYCHTNLTQGTRKENRSYFPDELVIEENNPINSMEESKMRGIMIKQQ